MGLDMYLTAKKFVSKYNDEDAAIIKAIKVANIPGTTGMPLKYVEFDAIYWRKANAIHKWFVDHVQEQNDDCGYYYVSADKLVKLLDVCTKVLASRPDTKIAETLLPPQEGFFFGSAEIDDGYWVDIEETKTKLEALLNNTDMVGFTFYYHSSW